VVIDGRPSCLRRVTDESFLERMREDPAGVEWWLPQSLAHVCHAPIAERANGFQLLVDVYHRARRDGARRPALVFLHDWAKGKQPQMCGDRQCSYLALTADLFCIALYYRQPAEGRFPAALEDVKCAVRWLRSVAAEYAIDENKIIVMGSSAGTQWTWLAAATNGTPQYGGSEYGAFSSDVNMAILFSGMCDFVKDFGEKEVGEKIMGGRLAEMRERFVEASPLARLCAGMPPVLMVHGDLDQSCPLSSAEACRERLRELGVPCELLVRRGAGHDLTGPDSNLYLNLEAVRRFIGKRFGPEGGEAR